MARLLLAEVARGGRDCCACIVYPNTDICELVLETPVADEEYAGWIFEQSDAIAVAIDPTPLMLVRRDRLRIQLETTPIYAIIIIFKMGVESLIYSVVGGYRRRSERGLLTALSGRDDSIFGLRLAQSRLKSMCIWRRRRWGRWLRLR